MGIQNLRVAAVQQSGDDNIVANTEKLLSNLHKCADDGVQIAAFPEGVLFGYTNDKEFWANLNQTELDNAEAQIAKTCAKRKIAAVVGSSHMEEGQRYNSLTVFDENGKILCRYGKIFLAGEPWCIGGDILPVVTLWGVKCCMLICHDIRYPELVRLPAAMGAQVCFFCSNESSIVHDYKLSAYRAMPISRATENTIYLIMANAPADRENPDRSGSSHGNSKIINPDGNVLVEAGYWKDETVTWDIDLAKATGSIANRTMTEETFLKGWLRQGLELVTIIE